MVSLRVGFLLCLVSWAAAERARYDNYQVFNIVPRSVADVKLLHDLQRQTNEFTFWTDRVVLNTPVVVMVAPHQRPLFHDFIKSNGLEVSVKIENLQTLIDREAEQLEKRPRELEWTNYHNLAEFNAWLAEQETANPDTVELFQYGTSHEGNPLNALTIFNDETLPAVIFEAGMHGREWIGPAASSWIFNEILNSENGSIWKQFNFLYIPIANPDGYKYTWGGDRLWRKTRKTYDAPGGLTCYGSDPNRNFDFHWMEGGSSSDPCAEDFAGDAPFSEPETMILARYYEHLIKVDIYIAFHSFSQLLMYPWGYTGDPAPNAEIWKSIGDKAAAALKEVHQMEFKVGNIHDTNFPVSGSSIEWFYGNFNTTLAYTFEGRDTGENGFLLPADQIIPSAEELQAAIRTILEEFQKLPK